MSGGDTGDILRNRSAAQKFFHRRPRLGRGHVKQRGCVMSGRSTWATIKHKKGATDAKRGRVFTRVSLEISIAARIGGAEPDTNPRLRTAILATKPANILAQDVERSM